MAAYRQEPRYLGHTTFSPLIFYSILIQVLDSSSSGTLPHNEQVPSFCSKEKVLQETKVIHRQGCNNSRLMVVFYLENFNLKSL